MLAFDGIFNLAYVGTGKEIDKNTVLSRIERKGSLYVLLVLLHIAQLLMWRLFKKLQMELYDPGFPLHFLDICQSS